VSAGITALDNSRRWWLQKTLAAETSAVNFSGEVALDGTSSNRRPKK